MDTLVSQMTKDELAQLIESIIEKKFSELLAISDEGELRPEVVQRLHKQHDGVLQGDAGISIDDVLDELELG